MKKSAGKFVKKMGAAVLSLALVLSFVPGVAFAAESDPSENAGGGDGHLSPDSRSASSISPSASNFDDSDCNFDATSGTLTIKTNAGSTNWKDKGSYFVSGDILLLVIEENVTQIGNSAFGQLKNLEDVAFTGTSRLESIGDSAFYNCGSLTSITLPEGVSSIGNDAFSGCLELPVINFPAGLTTLGVRIFENCTSLISANLLACTNLTELGESMFYLCSRLSNVSLPPTLTIIAQSAFSGCSSLRSIDIPPGVYAIGHNAFQEAGIISINIPDGVTIIEPAAFVRCASLTSITIPDGVTSIEEATFWECTSLKSVNIGSVVTSIEPTAFAYCSALKTLTFNSKKAPTLGEAAFMGIPTGGTLYYPAGGIDYNASNFNKATGDQDIFSKWTFSTGDSYPTNFDTLVEGKDIIIANKAWTGKQIKSGLKIDIIYQSNGKDAIKTLVQGKDYAITKYGANKNIGKGTISIKAEGEFSGEKALAFNIVPKTPTKFKVKAAKKSLKVSFKKVSKAQKVKTYKVEYRLSGKGAWKSKTVKVGKKATVSLTIKKLKSKKKYQVRAYAYKGAYKGYPTKTKQKKVK